MEVTKKYDRSIKYGRVRLLRRADNGFWYAKYRLPDSSKWVEKSLRTNREKDAEKMADFLNVQLVNKSIGIADGTFPIDTLFEKYFVAMKGHIHPESIKRFSSTRHILERWLAQNCPSIKMVRQLTVDIVREFQGYRVNEGASKRTVDNDIATMHTIFKWGVREGLVAKSPFDYSMRTGSVRLYKEPQKERDTYSVEEYGLLLEAAERTGDRLIRDMIIVLADTGMRFGEMSHLTPDALHWDPKEPYIEIRARHGWTPKDPNEIRVIPMTPIVQEVLKRHAATAKRGLLFSNRNGKVIAENHSRDRLQRLFPATGISADRRLHWHSWRNYFIIRRLEANEPLQRIMQWTGHDSEALVIHYAKARAKAKEGATRFKEAAPSWGKNEKTSFSQS